MKKSIKVWLIVAVSLILLGSILFGGIMMKLKWDFSKFSTIKYQENNYEILEEYQSVLIKTDTADITFIPSSDQKTSINCYEYQKSKHDVKVVDGTLEIKVNDTRKWYDYISIGFASPKISISIPEKQYQNLTINSSTSDITLPENFEFKTIDILNDTGDVYSKASAVESIKIATSTGEVKIENVVTGSLDLSTTTGMIDVSDVSCSGDVKVCVSTGNVVLTNLTAKNFNSVGNTGKINLSNVVMSEKLSIERSTGDVKLDKCDASELFIKTGTGDVTGTINSEKIFFHKTNTGNVELPQTLTGGKCEIVTSTGDIKIQIG